MTDDKADGAAGQELFLVSTFCLGFDFFTVLCHGGVAHGQQKLLQRPDTLSIFWHVEDGMFAELGFAALAIHENGVTFTAMLHRRRRHPARATAQGQARRSRSKSSRPSWCAASGSCWA